MRNSAGAMLAASARWKDSMGLVPMAEVESFRDGVRLIPAGTRERIVVESDCLELVMLWKNKGNHRSEIKAILDDVEEMISNFTSF
jgi:uncharacterized protein YeaC (DUF1315 family)